MSYIDRLSKWKKAGYINDLITEFVRFLIQIDENISDEVLTAATCCMFMQQDGHICLDLNKPDSNIFLFEEKETGVRLDAKTFSAWNSALLGSDIVGKAGETKPLILEENRLYIHRYWTYEEELTEWINKRSSQTNELSKEEIDVLSKFINPSQDLFEVNWQQIAICLSFIKDFLVISGGPGTGKTYTVLNIIAAQALANADDNYRIALAAPTGKAARRLINSIEKGKNNLSKEIVGKIKLPESALTVHKLLGANYSGSRFKYGKENPLPYDLIVIDEASMLDITMWTRLLRAVGSDTKLIVLGDKDQLASVEAGSILGDLCGGENSFSAHIVDRISKLTGFNIPKEDNPSIASINDCVLFLTKSYRFNEHSGIKNLSDAIKRSDFEQVWSLLNSTEYPDIEVAEPNSETMGRLIEEYAVRHHQQVVASDEKRLPVSNEKKILCAMRKSELGTERINLNAEKQIKRNIGVLISEDWYDGRTVMATKNNGLLRIKNGELGIFNKNDGLVHFEGENDIQVSPARLVDYEPAFAITIHKSQGSEFNDVAIILPSKENSILSKEILYTAVTRARRNTLVIASKEILKKTITRSISRNSGVRQKIWG
ncbi:exodeoxyribonuclease V subunit alpha [Gracilimonas sp.]|uniref:exodeoxyribonuclease V subunit alpha n=1 Tax=Gracilimonas sp. TaxID=1974203 RepID=UPI002872A501|nr:exodeoxyribonuclease V subunit alpha [Gracilimonas sp.]